MLAIAKSSRTSTEIDLINWQKATEGGHVQVLGIGKESEKTIQAQIDFDVESKKDSNKPLPALRKSLRLNGLPRVSSDFVGNINIVCFEVNDINILMGPPSNRRRYIDILISQSDRGYIKTLQRYRNVIKHRNVLLKSIRENKSSESELAFWDDRLVYEGSAIISARKTAIFKLSEHLIPIHSELSQKHQVEISYKPQVFKQNDQLTTVSEINRDEIKKILSVNLTKFRVREISYGISLTGPHRDDLEIKLNGQMASKYASRGQSRIITLALKLSEASLLKELNNRTPILALDDILSELDKRTQSLVLKSIENYEQVFITATDLGTFEPEHLSTAALYTVDDGMVSKNK